MQAFEAALRRKDADARFFFAPKSLRVGGFWLPELAQGIAEATAFILLVGEKGIGPWQAMEYYEALDRRVKQLDFPVVLLLLEDQPAPGLPFLRQLHWVITPDVTSRRVSLWSWRQRPAAARRQGNCGGTPRPIVAFPP